MGIGTVRNDYESSLPLDNEVLKYFCIFVK